MIIWLMLSCAPKAPPVTLEAVPQPQIESAAVPPDHESVVGATDPRLRALLFDTWETQMKWFPIWATSIGDHRFDTKLPDNGGAALEERRDKVRKWIATAQGIEGLSGADLDHQQLYLVEMRSSVSTEPCRFEHWSVSPRGNALGMFNELPHRISIETAEEGDALIERFNAAPAYIEQDMANLRVGLVDGWVANAESVRRVVEMLDTQLEKPIEDWGMMDSLDELPEALAGHAEKRRASVDSMRPALVAYRNFLADELLPKARPDTRPGLAGLPGGTACYAALAESHTTLTTPPEELHEIGLEALEGIHAEFSDLGEKLFQTRDLATIFERLRTDEDLYFTTEEEVEDTAREALARANEVVPEWFGRLPEAECEVVRVPDYAAPYTTIAYYRRASPDGARPGRYNINVYQPETRPRHEAEVLAFHESVPGHHLQIAISQELGELPAFRRHMGMTAFVEGWALYTERLSDEMGLYSGDIDRMGILSFDAWRAARLVVDTGIHQNGWSRERAVRFMSDNTPLALNNIDNEVDRYITTPGQALAYKVGQLEIRSLRATAEAELGDGFALADFHDVVLGAGAIPLPALRERIAQWISKGGGPRPR